MLASGVPSFQLGGLTGDVLGMPGVFTNTEENQWAFRLGLLGVGPMAAEQRAPVKVPSTSPSIRDGIKRDYADACCKGPPSISWPTRMTRSRSRSPRRLIADAVDAENHEATMARFRKATKAARVNGVSEPHTPSLIRGRSVSLPGGDGDRVPATLTEAVRPEHPGPASLPEPAHYEKKDVTENRVKKPKVTVPPSAPGKWTCVCCQAPFEREHYSKWLATRSSQRSNGRQRCNLCYAGRKLKKKGRRRTQLIDGAKEVSAKMSWVIVD